MRSLPQQLFRWSDRVEPHHRSFFRQFAASLLWLLHITFDDELRHPNGGLGARLAPAYGEPKSSEQQGRSDTSTLAAITGFSRARWTTDEVGLTLAAMVVQRLPPDGSSVSSSTIRLGDTGKRVAGASMHRDPLLSTVRMPFFHWGHVWVVLAIGVTLFEDLGPVAKRYPKRRFELLGDAAYTNATLIERRPDNLT